MAGTTAFEGSRSSKLVPLIVAGSIGSLKVAVTLAPVETLVAPSAGERAVIVGGMVSGPTVFSKTTSTQ